MSASADWRSRLSKITMGLKIPPRGSKTARSAPSTDAHTTFVAYELHADTGFEPVPAPPTRAWMTATQARFANRCLPLLMANQSGWFVLNSTPVHLTWDGGAGLECLAVNYENRAPLYRAISHFGHGIVTWNLPFLFRTSPGYNLLVRGPANWIKDGVSPLEGLVETDWSPATFTVNWKLTRPGLTVTFDADEPLCMLVPQRRGELEEFTPRIKRLGAAPDIQSSYSAWLQDRARFLRHLTIPSSDAAREGWQRHYFRGRASDGSRFPDHQTKVQLERFLRI
jgi:Family of unknown function (DUF6065)